VIFAGGGRGEVRGGDRGWGGPHPSGMVCSFKGLGGYAIVGVTGSVIWYSGGTVQGGNSLNPQTCHPIPQLPISSLGMVTAATGEQ